MDSDRTSADRLLVMGRIAAPYGVKGWLRIVPYTASMEALLDYSQWHIGRAGDWRSVNVINGRPHGKGLVVQLAECTDRDAAALLTGTEIAVHRSALPAAGTDEYYWDDLLGMQVVTEAGQVLGKVDHLLETGANDVLVLKGERERLVPFVTGQVIKAVDLDAGVIRVDWDEEF